MSQKAQRIQMEKRKKRIKPGTKLFLGTLPLLILYFLFSYLPLTGIAYAFFDWKPGYDLFDCKFVGLKHFIYMFDNPIVRRESLRVLKNTVGMSLLGYVFGPLPMIFAIFLNEIPGKRLKKGIQTLTTIPNFISWVIIYSLAMAMFSTETGVLNIFLKNLGIIDEPLNILASDKHVWLTMSLYGVWKSIGWSAILYLAAINSIDTELYEAAAVDGAGRFAKMWHITVPGLLPTYITLLVMGIGNFLNQGIEQYKVFENAFNSKHIEVLDLYTYNLAFGEASFSYSTAVGLMKSLVGVALFFLANQISGKVRDKKLF